MTARASDGRISFYGHVIWYTLYLSPHVLLCTPQPFSLALSLSLFLSLSVASDSRLIREIFCVGLRRTGSVAASLRQIRPRKEESPFSNFNLKTSRRMSNVSAMFRRGGGGGGGEFACNSECLLCHLNCKCLVLNIISCVPVIVTLIKFITGVIS